MRSLVIVFVSFGTGHSLAAEPPNLNKIANDLTIPAVSDGKPVAGKRVKRTLPGRENLYHILYLPTDWEAGKKYPIIAEYPGNGNYSNALGDKSTGKHEDCVLGYGVTGGKGAIWVCLPFVDPKANAHTITWWGDPDATAEYARAAVADTVKEFGGDESKVILAGFSRGAIACNYIGLRDDATAKVWAGFICHSHYDGVRTWPHADSDKKSAGARLARLNGRPQWVSHETSVTETKKHLADTKGNFTFVSLSFPNHSAEWVLKDVPERKQLREWYANVVK